jgi:hypothetical protein
MENKHYRWHVIHERIKDIPSPIGAEIGVHRGECSGHLLELHPGLKLYMIDMWSPNTYKGKGDDAATGPYRELYEKECHDNYLKTVEAVHKFEDRSFLITDNSVSASELFFPESLDFCFIDASHAYEDVKADILAWLPKIKPSGFLFLHDFGLFDGVTRAVQELFPSDAKHLNWPEIDDDYMAVVRV